MECGECTLCCKLLKIGDVSKVNEDCRYCDPNLGCIIYNERPEPCRIFECCWKQMKNAGEELRPDKCNVVFEKWSDNLIVGATIEPISNLILNQIDFFRDEGISVLIVDYGKKSKTYFLADNHTKEFIRKEIYDGSKLHK